MEIRTKRVAASGGLVGLAMLVAVPFIVDREGESLESYRDVVGVWTICNGETLGVKPGMKKTAEECRQLTNSRVGQFMRRVYELQTVEVAPETLAAHTSFAYNIGIGGYAKSTTLRKTNAGDVAGGCEAMLNWYKAGGKDCRPRRSGCYGLWNRRKDERALCLAGVVK